MVFLLTKFGHEALGVRDGMEGVKKAKQERPDLILLDIHMPRLDGYEAARLIRHSSECSGIPLVAVTALAMVGDREKIMSAGFTGYISKPIDPETFPTQVLGYLGSAHQSGMDPAVIAKQNDFAVAHLPGKNFAVVLVVDNSQTNLDLLRVTLGNSGYDVLTARSATEGLDLGQRTNPDLIISDVHMPQQDGFEFLRMIQTDARLSKVPFVFLSSSIWSLRDQEDGLALGAKKFLTRPIEPQVLLDQLKDCIPKLMTSRAAATAPGDSRVFGEKG